MKFLLTRELGKLARWLRILGFDAEYLREIRASSFIIKALQEDRIIISRNRKLPKARGVKIVFIDSEILNEQIKEVQQRLNIKYDSKQMFTRCIVCNEQLKAIEKELVRDKVPPLVFDEQTEFVICPKCQRVYWQGTHWGKVKETLEGIDIK